MRRIVIVLFVAMAISSAQAQLSPPAQALNAGFGRLSFDEEFDVPPDIGYGASGHKWNAGLWWDKIPMPCAFQFPGGGILTIIGPLNNHTDLCTQYHDASGGTYFLGGYFEARMRCTDWSAFWLFCADRPFVWGKLVTQSNPMSWTNEIDIIETDPEEPETAFCTLHSNSSGDGGVPDTLNEPHAFALGRQLVGEWHTYGVLWTREKISWYLDNQQIASAQPFASSWQPAQLILSASAGGVNGGASTVSPPITQVGWVRVWEK